MSADTQKITTEANAPKETQADPVTGASSARQADIAPDIHTAGDNKVHTTRSADRRHDRSIAEKDAWGILQTLTCLATDFIDPYVGVKIEKKLDEKYLKQNPYQKQMRDAWWGEISGDFAALATFMGIVRFAPRLVDKLKTVMDKTVVEVNYKLFGQKKIDKWATHHGIEKGSAEYNARVAAWRDEQAETYANTSIISAGSTIYNVAMQKMVMHSPHRVLAISAGKISGQLVTVGTFLGLRALLPRAMEGLDRDLGDRYIAPVIHEYQKLTGHKFQPDMQAPAQKMQTESTPDTATASFAAMETRPSSMPTAKDAAAIALARKPASTSYTDNVVQQKEQASSLAVTAQAL